MTVEVERIRAFHFKAVTRIPDTLVSVMRLPLRRPVCMVTLLYPIFEDEYRSCFGAGFWDNQKPYLNDEPWKNQ